MFHRRVRKSPTPSLMLGPTESKDSLSQSPVPHLLVSNEPPTEKEIYLIDHAIRRAEAEISELTRAQKATKVTQPHVGELGIEKQASISRARSFIHQHSALFSVRRRIPQEILQEIIIWTTVDQPTYKMQKLRWELTQVSHAWRKATLSLSFLWAELPTVKLPTPNEQCTKRQVQCMQEILRRSGDAPLNVSIDLLEDVSKHGQDTAGWHPAIFLIAQHSERWQTASIRMPHPSLVGLRTIKNRIPMLKTLSLQVDVGYGPVRLPLDMFENAPSLLRVHLNGWVPHDFNLPFLQLEHYKHVSITELSLARVTSFCTDYSSLKSLMITQTTYGIAFPPATLPRLQKLEVIVNIPLQDRTTHFFDDLKVPVLEELTVAFPYHVSPRVIPSIVAMLKNSTPCRLKTLNLRPGTTEPLQLTTLLELTPELISLDTTCPPHVDIQNLTNMARSRPLIPLLQSCKFAFEFVIERALDSNTRSALNRLATARCEVGYGVPMTLSVYSVFNQVDDIPWSHFKQRQLEDWALTSIGKQLEKVNVLLASQIRVFTLPKPDRIISRAKEQSIERIGRALDELEGIYVKHAKDIYMSGVHLTLKLLADIPPATDKHGFSQRAKVVLRKWDPILLANQAHVHWGFHGPYSLTYIPIGDEIRTSRDALDVVYGLRNEMSADEARWPVSLANHGISLHWPRKTAYYMPPL